MPEGDLRSLDPIWTTSGVTRTYAYMVYDQLFALDDKFKAQPQMVDKWSVSADKLKYTFTLRDGLRWHDGAPVRPEDCIASIERWTKRDVLGQSLAAVITEMKPVDAKTFTIQLKSPFPAHHRRLREARGRRAVHHAGARCQDRREHADLGSHRLRGRSSS